MEEAGSKEKEYRSEKSEKGSAKSESGPVPTDRVDDPETIAAYDTERSKKHFTVADEIEREIFYTAALWPGPTVAELREQWKVVDREIENMISNVAPASGMAATHVEDRRDILVRKRASIEADINRHMRAESIGSDSDHRAKRGLIKRHPDLTIDRAILLIDAIGSSRLKSADRDKLAEVIAFLTGDSPESVRQRYSALNPENSKYKGTTESGMQALQKDLEILTTYFDMIGLRNESTNLANKFGIPLKR